jgi:SAM-dependent methyltransferase
MRQQQLRNSYANLESSAPPLDLAKVEHWERVWKCTHPVRSVSRFNYYDFRLAALLRSLIHPGSRVIEIGCGGSRWIRFFSQELNCETWGIDYSQEGLAMTNRSFPNGQNVHLVSGDFFDAALLPFNYFDLVFSGGFIEHFSDATAVTRRFAQILRTNGKVLTLTPNFLGIYKYLQKGMAPEIFAKHVPMDHNDLDSAHAAVGLVPIVPARFWGCFAPGVVNFGKASPLLLPPIKVLQQIVCWSLHAIHLDRDSHFSPYLAGIYQKQADQ